MPEDKQNIKLKLIKDVSVDKDGKKVVDEEKILCQECQKLIRTEKEPRYKQHDIIGLLEMLNFYDTRKKGSFMKEARNYLNVKDKLTNAFQKDLEQVSLTLDEASFLKNFLKDFPDNEGQQARLKDFQIRTVFSVLEALS